MAKLVAPTPHIQAQVGEIAETVLLPGDPLRAKFIADTYLENVKQFNQTRNMFGFTGTYKGRPVSVMGTGMGCPSMGIYSYEPVSYTHLQRDGLRHGQLHHQQLRRNAGPARHLCSDLQL